MTQSLVRVAAAGLAAAMWLAGCGDDGDTRNGFHSVGTGDTAGEWELFAEFEDGEWTGCLRIDHFGVVEECAEPGDDLVRFESGEGATFGAVPEGEELVFDDGREVPLIEDRFFVVSSEADVRLE